MLALLAALTLAAPPSVLDAAAAAHLARRAGLSARPDETAPLVGLTREAAVLRLLGGMTTTAQTPLPDAVTSPLSFPAPADKDEPAVVADIAAESGTDVSSLKAPARAIAARLRQKGLSLKAWWIEELCVTTSPLTERVTLVLHDHFTSALRKVRDPRLMARQNALFRTHAGGSYRALLHAVVDDAAMLKYLDASGSDKDAPNENLARELLELFTLGEGHYTEADVKVAARALTGRNVRKLDGEVVRRPRRHDAGEKTFLGVTGAHGPKELVDILLAQPRTAVTITEKLWVDFIGEDIDAARVAAIAGAFRAADYDMKVLLRGLLLEEAFWRAEPGVIVPPVELVVSAARLARPLLEGAQADRDALDVLRPTHLALEAKRMGQDLLDPLSVKGWPSGKALVTTATIAPRDRFLRAVARALEDVDLNDDADALLAPQFQTR